MNEETSKYGRNGIHGEAVKVNITANKRKKQSTQKILHNQIKQTIQGQYDMQRHANRAAGSAGVIDLIANSKREEKNQEGNRAGFRNALNPKKQF